MSTTSATYSHAARGVLSAILAVVLSGCATYNRIADYPEPAKPVPATVAAKPMSKMSELPVGAHYDEEHHIIVTGHQKGMFAGMMFGIVGVLATDAINKSSGAKRFGEEAAKGDDLGYVLEQLMGEAIAAGSADGWSVAAGEQGLQLTPYAVFTVEKKSNDARLYAMIRAELPGPDGKPLWSTRYFARAPGLHPLAENTGWMVDNRFADGMRVALQRALDACIADTRGQLTGTDQITAKGKFAFLNVDLPLYAIVVRDGPETIVVKLPAGDAMVLAGTHVLIRSDYEIKPAKFKDPRPKTVAANK